MRQAALLVCLAAAAIWTAGCAPQYWTEVDLGYGRVKLRGTITGAPERHAAADEQFEGLPAYMTFNGGTRPLQVEIETRFVDVKKNEWLDGLEMNFVLFTGSEFRRIRPSNHNLHTESEGFRFTGGGTFTRFTGDGDDEPADPIASPDERHGSGRMVSGGGAVSFGAHRERVTGFTTSYTLADAVDTDLLRRAMQRDAAARTLATPRVTARTGEEAPLRVSQPLTYPQPTEKPEIDRAVEGVFLEVVPVVSSDRKFVRMDLSPQIATLIPVQFATDPKAATEAQRGQTQSQASVTLTTGETTTILLDGKPLKGDGAGDQVPILSKIPVIKHFFTRRGTSRDRRTLLILVKPKIIIQEE